MAHLSRKSQCIIDVVYLQSCSVWVNGVHIAVRTTACPCACYQLVGFYRTIEKLQTPNSIQQAFKYWMPPPSVLFTTYFIPKWPWTIIPKIWFIHICMRKCVVAVSLVKLHLVHHKIVLTVFGTRAMHAWTQRQKHNDCRGSNAECRGSNAEGVRIAEAVKFWGFWSRNVESWSISVAYYRQFLARDSMLSALYAIANPSVCLSHGWISRKRLNLGACNFHHTVAPSL